MTGDPVSAGVSLLDQNRVNEALACFESADDRSAWFGRAVALHLLGRLDEAEAAYLRVMEQMPNEEALANLVALAVEKFDLERVELYSRKLLEINAEATIGWQGLLVVAVERRDYESAAAYLGRVESRGAIKDESAIQYRLSGNLADRLRAELQRGGNGALARSR
jgi:tetratricopeptide (TPR) repeat protein